MHEYFAFVKSSLDKEEDSTHLNGLKLTLLKCNSFITGINVMLEFREPIIIKYWRLTFQYYVAQIQNDRIEQHSQTTIGKMSVPIMPF